MLAGEVLRVGEFKSGNTKIELRVHSETDPDVDGAECGAPADDAASVLNFRGSDISEDTGGAQLYRWDHGYGGRSSSWVSSGRGRSDARSRTLWAGTAELRAQRVRRARRASAPSPRLRGPHHGAALGEARPPGRGRPRPHDHLERGRRPHGQQQRLQLRGQVLAPRGDVPPIYPLDDMLTGPDAAAGGDVRAGHDAGRLRQRPSRAPPSPPPCAGLGHGLLRARRGDHRRGPRRLHGPGHRRLGRRVEAWYGESIAEAGMLGQEAPSSRARSRPSRRPRSRGPRAYALEPTALRVAWAPPAATAARPSSATSCSGVSEDFRNTTPGYGRAPRRRRARRPGTTSRSRPCPRRCPASCAWRPTTATLPPFAATSPAAPSARCTPGPPGRRRWTSRRAWASGRGRAGDAKLRVRRRPRGAGDRRAPPSGAARRLLVAGRARVVLGLGDGLPGRRAGPADGRREPRARARARLRGRGTAFNAEGASPAAATEPAYATTLDGAGHAPSEASRRRSTR